MTRWSYSSARGHGGIRLASREGHTETYRHFVAAIDEWDACAALQLEEPSEELLDQTADSSARLALDEVIVDVTAQFCEAAADAAVPSHAGSTSLGNASARAAA